MPVAISSHYSETILTVIAREYGPMRHAAKILAQHAQGSYRTAEAWIAGRSVPSGENLISLMASCDVLTDEINRLVTERKQSRE